jgi:uncharacterized protein (TIGR03083 family)
METVEYLAFIRDRTQALLSVARGNLDVAVPSCPGWTNADLVAHVGGVWGWVSAIVRTGERSDLPAAPADVSGAALVGWAAEQLDGMLNTLEKADPTANCWTFGLPRTPVFWFRRQALEAAVHAWDSEGTITDPAPLDSELARDGIDEFLTLMLPRQVKRHPDGWTGQSLYFHRTDGEGQWTVQLGPDGHVTTDHSHEKGDVALHGPASLLYLWCLNRMPTKDLELFGDPAVAAQWTSEVEF